MPESKRRKTPLTVEDLYPDLGFDLDEDLEPQVETLLAGGLSDYVARRVGVTEGGDIARLNTGLYTAIEAYVNGALERAGQRTESDENDALERVSQKVQGLYDVLLDLADYPGLETRLERAIRTFPHHHQLTSGVDLPQIVGNRRNIFQEFREVLVDLQACAEAEINRKPKPVVLEATEDGEDPIRLDSDADIEEQMREWRQRSRDRKFEKDHALLEFLRAFKPYWQDLSHHPFTHGMYYIELRDTLSPLVDVLELIMRRVDGAVTRANITSSLRKLREMGGDDLS